MTEDLQIRQFQLADREALLSFLRAAYPDDPRKSDPAYWQWHHLDNPYVDPADIPLWVVAGNREIVGQLASIPVDLNVGGETVRAIWIVDIVVRADLRGRGLGKRLILAGRAHCPTMIALGMNEQSKAVLRSLQWVPLGGIHRYQHLLFAGNAFRGIRGISPLRGAANLLSAPWRPALGRIPPASNRVLREVTRFDASFDDLWQRCSSQWPCAVKRDARYLEWQFMRQPGKRFEVRGLYENGRLLGYVVLFCRKAADGGAPPKVAISDLCYDSSAAGDAVDQLLAAALHLAVERRAGSLVTDVLDAAVEKRFLQCGFWRVKRSPEFMASVATWQDVLCQPNNWFLTRADSDVSIFEGSNL